MPDIPQSHIGRSLAGKIAWRWLVALFAVATSAVLAGYAYLAVPVGTGLAAKQLCSLVFVSKLPPAQAMTQYVHPLLGPLPLVLSWEVDPTTKQVHTNALGFAPARAVAHPGYGCIQLIDRSPSEVAQLLPARTPLHHSRPELVTHPVLQPTLEQVINQPHTKAVLIAHAGEIVAEAYAPGVHNQTPLPAWSMTKSVTTALIGMLAHEAMMSTDEVALFEAWRDTERDHISLDQLLRMTSGIDIDETQTGADANSHMLFKASDSAAFAISRGIAEAPGETFSYTSGSTVLAASVITDRLGGPEPTYSYIFNKLLDPLGMHHSFLEPDEVGTFIGSSFMMASARDWAKFGQLHLQRGNWQGQQLFGTDWIDYITEPTPASGTRSYGAGFWLAARAAADHPLARWPEDTYIASGLQNNRLVIIPSRNLLVVRLGATLRFSDSGVVELVNAALEAYPD